MTFKVKIHPEVAKAIRSIPKSHQKKVAKLFEVLKEDPVPYRTFDVRKLKGYHNRFRVSFGKYRLIYEIDKKEKTALVLKLKKRESIYLLSIMILAFIFAISSFISANSYMRF